MLPSTATRVTSHTSDSVNERIRRETEERVRHFAHAGDDAIHRRLVKLDHEWDVERCLETLAPSFTLTGILLGLGVDRRWFVLPLVVQTFFLQHALQGWCPPLAVLRRLGIRTMEEINEDRMALKALRGDFSENSVHEMSAGTALAAARQ